MKTVYNYILVSALAIATIGCTHEELNPTIPSEANGNEVKFGMSLDVPDTKTIYGPESNNAFPIYWSQGDKVLVASPQCAVTNAEYEVTPVSGQSYAEALNKTGAAGVQWGSTNADFYSVYPSTNSSWSSLTASNVTAKLNIASQQNANIVLDGTTFNAADMSNVIMYAQTNNVENGKTVDLKYKPYSTMIEFELKIAENTDEQGNSIGFGSIKVLSLTLTAPTGIALTGDFSLQFNGNDVPTITAAGNNGNSIKMDFATQPLLDKTNQTLKAKLAMIPIEVKEIANWTIAVEVLKGTDTTPTTYTREININSALVPGQIHKIKLPKFKSEDAWNPSLDKWVTTLYDYKNIYITELSLPGAWYAGAPADDGYQSTASISDLWNAGIRAFAVECRTVTSGRFNSTPNGVSISGTQSRGGIIGTSDYCYGGTRISSVISEIASAVAATETTDENGIKDGEYAVLILSYADGGNGGHRDADYAYFINGIKTEIANAGVSNIYTDVVSANTTVSNVLGKLIIKINVDDRLPKSSYTGDMNALFSYNPLIQQLTATNYEKPLFADLYWKTWEDSYRNLATYDNSRFLWCFASANRTQVDTGTDTTIPKYSERQTVLRGMMEHSKELTNSKSHNVWFYFNAGGTQTTSMTDGNTSAIDFAATMNSWLYDLVKLKANGGTDTNGVYGTKGAYIESDPSPLGIVMFNQCTNSTYYGPEIIKEIVHMNNKFKLLRYDPTTPASTYSATAIVGGDAF